MDAVEVDIWHRIGVSMGPALRSGALRRRLSDPGTDESDARELAEALCALAAEAPHERIEAGLSLVPALHRRMGDSLGERAKADAARARSQAETAAFARRLTDPAAWADQARRARAALLALMAEGLVDGPAIALSRYFRRWIDMGCRLPEGYSKEELEWQLRSGGWYLGWSAQDYRALADAILAAPLPDQRACEAILSALCLSRDASHDHLKLVHVITLAPLIRRCFDENAINAASSMLMMSFQICGYLEATEAGFDAFVRSYAETTYAAGCRLAEGLERDDPAPAFTAPRRIAFVTRGAEADAAEMAHLLSAMRFLAADHGRYAVTLYLLGAPPYVRGSPPQSVAAFCEGAGVGLVALGDKASRPSDHLRRYLELRRRLRVEGIQAVFWFGALSEPFFLFGLGLAPVQILFSQYLHPQLDWLAAVHRMTYGAASLTWQTFHERRWRVAPSCLPPPDREIPPDEPERLRREFGAPARILLGVLARAEKIASPPYLDVVIELLRRHPEALFLWTGRSEHPDIVGRFRRAGVLKQTKFIGWVDTRLYARVLDVLLDSFPLCNGVTFLHAMEAGLACVAIDDPLSYYGRDIKFLIGGGGDRSSWAPPGMFDGLRAISQSLPIAADAQDYLVKAEALIVDGAYRRQVGALLARLYAAVYARTQTMGEAFSHHLEEILAFSQGTRT